MNYPYFNYQQPYQPAVPDMLTQLRQPATQDERIWVQNRGAADAYLMAPNSFVRLWDSQQPVFYEKRSDASGRPMIEVYEYHKQETQTAPADDVLDRLEAMEQRLATLEGRQHESDADDSAVQSVQKPVSRRSKTAGPGSSEQRPDDTAAV